MRKEYQVLQEKTEREFPLVVNAVERLLQINVKELGLHVKMPESLKANDLGEAVRELLYSSTKAFLDPKKTEANPHGSDRHNFQFGLYVVKSRTKEPRSVASKLRKQIINELSDKHALDLWNELAQLSDTANTQEKLIVLHKLNLQIKDLFAARAVVLSQRCKSNIARAVNLVARNAQDKFFKESNEYLLDKKSNITCRLRVLPESKWIICNPPVGYLYSSPYIVQQFFEVFHDRYDEAKLAAVFKELDGLDFKLSFRSTGYSSFQRYLGIDISANTAANDPTRIQNGQGSAALKLSFIFELQVRTILEDAWAEPEHRLSYKPDKPLSESTKVMFRNYGAQLGTSDDLLQVIVDRWQEETDDGKSLFENLYQSYPRKGDSWKGRKIVSLDRDLTRFYGLITEGYLTTALAFVRRMRKTYENEDIEIGVLLQLEEAVAMMQLSDEAALFEQARASLVRLCQQTSEYGLKSEGFAARYRLAVCELRILQTIPSPDLDEVRRLHADFQKFIDVELGNVEFKKHISGEYQIDGLLSDILSQQALCKKLEATYSPEPVRLTLLKEAVNTGKDCAVMAMSELGYQFGNFAKVDSTNYRAVYEHALKEKHKDAARLRWFALWGCNAILYCSVISGLADYDSVALAGVAKAFIVGVHDELAKVNEYLEQEGVTGEQTREMQESVDGIPLQDLKILHSLVAFRAQNLADSEDVKQWIPVVQVAGAIRHRLIDICCLGEHGFEREFFVALDTDLQKWTERIAGLDKAATGGADTPNELAKIKDYLRQVRVTTELTKSMQDSIDGMAIRDLKTLHSQVTTRAKDLADSKDVMLWIPVVQVASAIRHRLIDFGCLREHGFEREFFLELDADLQRWTVRKTELSYAAVDPAEMPKEMTNADDDIGLVGPPPHGAEA